MVRCWNSPAVARTATITVKNHIGWAGPAAMSARLTVSPVSTATLTMTNPITPDSAAPISAIAQGSLRVRSLSASLLTRCFMTSVLSW